MIRQCPCLDYFESRNDEHRNPTVYCDAHRLHPQPIEPGVWGQPMRHSYGGTRGWYVVTAAERLRRQSLLGEAFVLPEQLRDDPDLTPQQGLGLDLIRTAIEDLTHPRGGEPAYDAARWLLGRGMSAISFEEALAGFDLDAERLRKRIVRYFNAQIDDALAWTPPALPPRRRDWEVTRRCARCHGDFMPTAIWQAFCGDVCREAHNAQARALAIAQYRDESISMTFPAGRNARPAMHEPEPAFVEGVL